MRSFAPSLLLACLLVGPPLLRSLRLEPESITIAGGIVLFLIAERLRARGVGFLPAPHWVERGLFTLTEVE